MKLEKGKVYQHYKGGKYRIVGEARHSETLEPLIVYWKLSNKTLWVRPKKMFLEKVEVNGKKVTRYKKIK
jgi:hypothetical protein